VDKRKRFGAWMGGYAMEATWMEIPPRNWEKKQESEVDAEQVYSVM